MDDILNEFQECEPVQLEPFIHQVGGHSSILCLDELLCKPLIKQEIKFYETLPTCMKKFVPDYRGVVQVRFEEDQDGYIRVAAYPPKSFRHQAAIKKRAKRSLIRLKNSGSNENEIEIESERKELFVDEEPATVPSGNCKASVRAAHNPWVLKCHRDHLSKLKRRAASPKEAHTQKFVLLENLTWRFEYPCVLDLKMGTRLYGDDATPDKIELQSAKAASSTSVQLGVRICGMQVYQSTTGKFICRNKYYGQKLGVDGFKEGLCQFLHNGNRLRTDAIVPIVEKLQELKAVLMTLDTFRFYTSSLLLIYEGLDPELSGDDEPGQSFPTPMDSNEVKPQKFSTTSMPKLKSTGTIFNTKFQDEVSHIIAKDLPEKGISTTSGATETNVSVPLLPAPCESGKGIHQLMLTESSLSSESVDVRLIDFAHATHDGLDKRHRIKEHAGPDTGFVFGLSNLIKVFQEIISEQI